MTILVQRRSTVLRRWTRPETWALTRTGYIHHLSANKSYPRPLKTISLSRPGTTIDGPIPQRDGNSILKIGWEIQPVYIAGKMITDGTYLWVFRGAAVRLFEFATNCRQVMREQRLLRGIVPVDLAARMAEYQRQREGAGGPRDAGGGLAAAAAA
jgi:hypothetical protein